MNQSLCCTACGDIVIKGLNNETKIRSKVLILRDDQSFAVCKGCGCEVPVPLKLDMDMAKSIVSSKKLRLYIKK